MKRESYYRGSKGKKYAIWNRQTKKFVFGILEDSPMLAEARLFYMIGDDARKCKFKPREIVFAIVDEQEEENENKN